MAFLDPMFFSSRWPFRSWGLTSPPL